MLYEPPINPRNPPRNGCTCSCHYGPEDDPIIQHVVDCCPPEPVGKLVSSTGHNGYEVKIKRLWVPVPDDAVILEDGDALYVAYSSGKYQWYYQDQWRYS